MWGYIFIFMKETIKREKKGKSFIKKEYGFKYDNTFFNSQKKVNKILYREKY